MFLIQLQGWVWIIFQSKIIIYTKYTSNTCLASLSFDRKIKYCAANTHPTYFIKKSHPEAGAGFKNTIKCWLCEIFARPILKNLKLPFLQPKKAESCIKFYEFLQLCKTKEGWNWILYQNIQRSPQDNFTVNLFKDFSWCVLKNYFSSKYWRDVRYSQSYRCVTY